MDPSVLCIVPTHRVKKYSIKDCLFNLSLQEHPHFDVNVMINNSSKSYFRYVEKITREYDNFTIEDLGMIRARKSDVVAKCINRGIDIALDFYYDYIFIVGSDNMVPTTALNILLEPFRDPEREMIGITALTTHYVFKAFGEKRRLPVVMALPDKKLDQKDYYAKKWKEVGGVGSNTMLIPREVFSKLRFKDALPKKKGHDFEYCLDLRAMGYKVLVRTDVHSPHVSKSGEMF